MNSDSNPYRIKGVVIDNKILLGLKDLRVEAWDKDFLFDDALGFADTDQQGAFEICFDEDRFQGFFERGPDLYFKIFHHNICIASTENFVLWNRKSGDIPVSMLAGRGMGAAGKAVNLGG